MLLRFQSLTSTHKKGLNCFCCNILHLTSKISQSTPVTMLVDQPFKQHFVFCGPQLPCPSARDIYEAQGSTCILKSIKTRMYVGRQPEQHGPSLRAFGYTRKNLPLHSQPKVQSRWSNSRPPIRENDYAVTLSTIPLSRLFNTQQTQSANKP